MHSWLYFHKSALANVVVGFHTTLILFFAISPLLGFFIPALALLAVVILGATLALQVLFHGCSLTKLERHIRRYGRDAQKGYEGSCIVHYCEVWFRWHVNRRAFTIIGLIILAADLALVATAYPF